MPNKIEAVLLELISDDRSQREAARAFLRSELEGQGDELVRILKSGQADLRRAVLEALPLVSSEETRERILAVAFADDDWVVLSSACWALEEPNPRHDEFWDRIVNLLEHDRWQVRQAALYAVSSSGVETSRKIGAITGCVNDTVWQVRSALADAISSLHSWDDVVSELINRLQFDREAGVRKSATCALRSLHPGIQFVREVLERLLLDPSWDVRIEACKTVGQYGAEAAFAIPALQLNRTLSDTVLREAAEQALNKVAK